MLKLKIQKEPYWLELGSSVKVKVKPCNSSVFYEAKAFMNNRVAETAKLYKSNKENGIIDPSIPNWEDVSKREAFAGIIEWDGVLEAESDEKAPLTPKKIEELFSNFWVVAENFRQQYCGIQEILEAEKNAFTSAQNGTSETDEPTAKDVAKKQTAQSTSADTSKQA